ncbi:MAG: EAL domain-containing protein [Alphaproteobacteria bacterium]
MSALRAERDRFVAFAFCAADILLELDARRTVSYAGGAMVALTGQGSEAILGRSVFDLFSDAEHAAIKGMLDSATDGTRIGPSHVWLRGAGDKSMPLLLTGYYLSDLGGRYFLALRLEGGELSPAAHSDEIRGASGIQTMAEFETAGAARLIEALKRGETAVLTVLELEGLKALRERLAAPARDELMAAVASTLRENSLGKDGAAELGAERYGLLHDPKLDLAGLKTSIGTTAKTVDPERRGVEVRTATFDVAPDGLDEGDSARAFLHAIRRIHSAEEQEITFEKLSRQLPREMKETARRIGDVRAVINTSAFDIAFQPIVDLGNRKIHHFEALARLRGDDANVSPYQFVRFAEEVGMVRDFDLAMCRRVLDFLNKTRAAGRHYPVAMNLSGRSLSSVEFVAELLNLLRSNEWAKKWLMFELTESANIADLNRTNKIIQSLRGTGHLICLDDFGAGEAAFHYLRALDVDMVKIDGSYVREALDNEKDRVFLKSIAGLCQDLKITTIAEMIEQEQSIDMVRKCGVKFGQGYYFGRPSLDISSFDPHRSADRRKDPSDLVKAS